jgi:hypothetical protein
MTNKQAVINFKKEESLHNTKVAECKLAIFIAEHCSIMTTDRSIKWIMQNHFQ